MIEDYDLVKNIKECNSNADESIRILSERHSGLFHSAVNRFVNHPNHSQFSGLSRDDIVENKESLIYDAALNFDEERGVQFNTYFKNSIRYYLGNQYRSFSRLFLFGDDGDYARLEDDADFKKKGLDKDYLIEEN